MNQDFFNPEVIKLCKSLSAFEMLGEVTKGNIRGLDMIAFKLLRNRSRLPNEVVNVLVLYFFNEFADKVYDRNDLARIYDYWATKQVNTLNKAIEITNLDIVQLLESIKNKAI